LNNQAVTSVLTGVDNLEQLQQNVELAAKGPLPRDIYEQAKAAVPVFSEDIIRPSNWQKHLKQ
jgi:aryl-alcohol dehydrogenase-like predicted oxidoreductase